MKFLTDLNLNKTGIESTFGAVKTVGKNVSTTDSVEIYSFPSSSYRVAKFIISTYTSSDYSVREILALHDNVDGYYTEYAIVSSGTETLDDNYSFDVVDGSAVLFIQPSTVSSREIQIQVTHLNPEVQDPLAPELTLVFTAPSASTEVLIPLSGISSVNIDWGDGTVDSGVTTSNPTHVYQKPGFYVVKVSGSATSLGSSSVDSRWSNNITGCLSFGNIGLTSLQSSFQQASQNVSMPRDIPSTVTNIREMFNSAYLFNQDIGSWNTSNVTNMYRTFLDAQDFNQNISGWDVGNVTTMNLMFRGATSFNQPIGSWDVGNVTDMSQMFRFVTNFDQDISSWDFGSVSLLGGFLQDTNGLSTDNYDALLIAWEAAASSLPAGISSPQIPHMGGSKYRDPLAGYARQRLIQDYGWTITDGGMADDAPMGLQVETVEASQTVEVPLAGTLNVDIDWGDGTVDTGVTTAYPQHTYASAGTYDVRVTGSATTLGRLPNSVGWTQRLKGVYQWGTLGFTSFARAFQGVQGNFFVPNYIPSTVTDLFASFAGCTTFNQDISGWNTENVVNMRELFSVAYQFNQPIGSWNTSNVTNMTSTFFSAINFNQDISNWDTSNVTSTNRMFWIASSFNQDIGSWNLASATNMGQMFDNADAFNQDISGWDFSGLNSSNGLDNFNANTTDTFSTENYDALLIAWEAAASASPAQIFSPLNPNMGESKYSSIEAQSARNILINQYGWTITDGGLLGAFSPEDIAGLQLWLDAADTSSITESGGAVSQWDDKSGNGYHVTQGSALNQPTTNATTINSRNVIDFGSSTGLVASNVSNWNFLHDGTNWTGFIVAKRNTDGVYGLLGTSTATTSSIGVEIVYFVNEAFYAAVYTGVSGAPAVTDASSNGSVPFGNADLLTLALDPDNPVAADRLNGWLNDAVIAGFVNALTNAPSASDASLPLVVGARRSTDYLGSLDGSIGEVLIYNSALSTVDRERVEDYLLRRWSIFRPGEFALQMETTAAGQVVEVPLAGTLNVDIDWGDGTVDTGITTAYPQHTYASAGSYDVRVTGSATTLGGAARGVEWTQRLKGVYQWGDLGFTSFLRAFRGVQGNFFVPSDVPSTVTNMNSMFQSASSFNQDISSWNTNSVVDTSLMFRDASVFNQNIGLWDTSNVASMNNMFQNADAFNQDISAWDFSGLDSSGDLDNFMALATGLSTTNYDALLIAWETAASASPAQIFSPLSPNMGGSQYSSLAAQFARDALITQYGWTITDGGLAAGSVTPTLWLDAADSSTITESGGAVSQWDDKSGNGYDVTQATAANQPTTGARTINGLNAINFDVSSHFLERATTPDLTRPKTLFFVLEPDAINLSWAFRAYSAQAAALTQRSSPNNWRLYNGTNQYFGTPVVGQADVIVHVMNGAASEGRQNGVSTGTIDTGTQNPNGVLIGASALNANAGFDGGFAEILIYDGVLSPTDITAVETWLKNKWNTP